MARCSRPRRSRPQDAVQPPETRRLDRLQVLPVPRRRRFEGRLCQDHREPESQEPQGRNPKNPSRAEAQRIPTITPMNLHPYLTPELLTLIRTAEPKEIAEHFCHRDREWWFEIAAKRKKAFSIIGYHERPINRFMMSSGYKGIKRRVELNQDNWREQFIEKLRMRRTTLVKAPSKSASWMCCR